MFMQNAKFLPPAVLTIMYEVPRKGNIPEQVYKIMYFSLHLQNVIRGKGMALIGVAFSLGKSEK